MAVGLGKIMGFKLPINFETLLINKYDRIF